MDINKILKKWKAESCFGERQYKKLDSSLVAGQTLYHLSYRAKVSLDGINKTIEKNKFFQTKTQGLTKKNGIDPKGDNYVCKQILDQLESDFFKEYNDFIDGEARKKTSQ